MENWTILLSPNENSERGKNYMTRIKQTITACLLSAMLVSSLALPAFAVDDISDDTQIVADITDNDSGGSAITADSDDTPTNPTDDTTVDDPQDEPADTDESLIDESESSSPVVEPSDEPQDEPQDESVDSSKPEQSSKQETSKQTSKQEESSKTAEIKTGKQTIRVFADFNFSRLSYTSDNMRVDFSKVQMTLLTKNGSKVLKRFDMKKIMSEWETIGSYDFTAEVPDWGHNGDSYILRFENLPDIYTSSTQDLPVTCKIIKNDYGTFVSGVDTVINCTLKRKDFNALVFVYDYNKNIAKNVTIEYYLENSEGKTIASGTTKTGNAGCAMLNFTENGMVDTDKNILHVSVPYAFNGSVATGTIRFPFDLPIGSENVYSIEADATEKEMTTGDDGSPLQNLLQIPVNVTFKNAYDMSMFEHGSFQLQLYSGESLGTVLEIDKNSANQQIFCADGGVYTLKGDSINYAIGVNPTTLHVTKNSVVNVEAVPQLSLTVINESNGVKKNAHFKVEGYSTEYNETSHQFAVNYGTVYKVTNLDNGEQYDVYISDYKTTILNLADGSITKDGYIGNSIQNNTPTTSTGTSSYNEVTSVPKTGDTILGIGLTLGGLTALSFTVYEYYKRKGKKHHEAKK